MKKNFLLNKLFCMTVLICGFIYGLALPFFWGNDPMSPTGTLSMLCAEHKIWFWLWGVLISGGFVVNCQYMYNTFGVKSKLLNGLSAMGFISMIFVALSLDHSIEDWNPKRIAHWVATGFFIAFTLASITFFFAIYRKKNRYFGILCLCSLAVIFTFFLLFIIIGKGAVMEMIPLAMMQLLMFVVNFTGIIKPGDVFEERLVAAKEG